MVTYASESKKMSMGAVGVGDGTFAVIDRGDDIAFEVGAWRLALGSGQPVPLPTYPTAHPFRSPNTGLTPPSWKWAYMTIGNPL